MAGMIILAKKIRAQKKLNILVMVEDVHKTKLFLPWL